MKARRAAATAKERYFYCTVSFSLAYNMSDLRGRKRSSYKQWLYHSDQSKPKVTKWREQKNTPSFNDERDESSWIDNSVEFEELGCDYDRALDVEECSRSSTLQFSDVCGTNTNESPPDCCFQSKENHSSDSSIEIPTVLETGLPIGKLIKLTILNLASASVATGARGKKT